LFHGSGLLAGTGLKTAQLSNHYAWSAITIQPGSQSGGGAVKKLTLPTEIETTPGWPGIHSQRCGLGNLDKLPDLQAGASNQGAIYLRLGKELSGITCAD